MTERLYGASTDRLPLSSTALMAELVAIQRRVVVLPPMTTLERTAWSKLEELVNTGEP